MNGLDDIDYKGVDVHNDNPGEQIVEIAKGNKYGYPFCFTAQAIERREHRRAGHAAVPRELPGNPHDDSWCATNSMKPTTFPDGALGPARSVFFDQQPRATSPRSTAAARSSPDARLVESRLGQHVGRMVVWVPFDADGTSPMPTTKKEGDSLVTTFKRDDLGPADGARRPQTAWTWNDSGAATTPAAVGRHDRRSTARSTSRATTMARSPRRHQK